MGFHQSAELLKEVGLHIWRIDVEMLNNYCQIAEKGRSFVFGVERGFQSLIFEIITNGL
jgi:hypothetical protein